MRTRPRAVDVAAVGLAALLALVLVLPHVATRPFWFDELVSLEIAELAPADFADYVLGTETNMALYHVLLRPWLLVTGDEAGVRALSVVLALATLPVLYALGRRLFDRRTAVPAVLLMAVNVSFVGYARDARSYSLTLLLVTASSLFLVRAVQERRERDAALYALCAGLAVWAQLFAGLVVGAQLLWVVLERRSVTRRQAAVALVVLGAFLVPLALALLLGRQGAQLDWLERPRLRQLPGLGEWFVESRATLALYAVGVVAALMAGWRAGTGARRRVALLLLWLVVPPAVAFVLSYVAEPVYLYRYFLVCLPALVLLVAAGFGRLRPAWLGVALAALAVGLSIRTVTGCQPDCKIRHDDWRAAAAWIEARQRPGDAIVVFPDEVRTPLDHELGERPGLRYPERWALTGGPSEGAADLDGALAGLDGRVWLVSWWLPSEPARAALRKRGELVGEREFSGNVRVELYRLRPS